MEKDIPQALRKMHESSRRLKAVLVGVAGSNNAFSLSIYNLKAYAYRDPEIRERWDINIIQHPLIGVAQRDKLLGELTEEIVTQEPDLVGFSCYMWNIEGFLRVAGDLHVKNPTTRVLLGGPEIVTEYVQQSKFDQYAVDYCISGEGELTFLELLRHLGDENPWLQDINGLSYRSDRQSSFHVNAKRTPFKSLSEIPSPFLKGVVDEEVLARKGVEANIETQRGCNLRCSYCIYHKDMDRVSYTEVSRVIDEIRFVTQRNVKKIRFVDANFSSNKNHAKSVMKALIQERFQTQLFFELIPGFIDEELADLFGQFVEVHTENQITIGVGVQTINRDVLKRMRRPIKKEKFKKTFELLQKHNIYTNIDHIIGLPGETVATIEQTLEYMVDQLRDSRAHLLCCHVMRGLPGTELLEIAKEDQMLFSSRHEPHEFIESPILPRSDMIKCLRRTGLLFRLINHIGWADREFIWDKRSKKTNIRDLFFSTRDYLGVRNIELVDLMVKPLVKHLKLRNSYFSMDDFPYAETWWWNHASHEISNDWIVNFLSDLDVRPNTR